MEQDERMNRAHVEKLRANSRAEAEIFRTVKGSVGTVKSSSRRINRNRRAIFEFNLITPNNEKNVHVLVPITLSRRFIDEIVIGGEIKAELEGLSPNYQHGKTHEYELKDFEVLGVTV